MNDLLQEIRMAFEDAAVPEHAGPMGAYMKGIAPYFGIKSPERKIIERIIFAATKGLSFPEIENIIRELYGQPERELHYLAMDWLYHRREEWTAETIHLIEHLIATKSWWDTVDFIAAHCLGEWAQRHPKEGLKAIRRYMDSGNLWLERSAIIHQLAYKKQANLSLLEEAILPHIRSKEFFHQKAIGWALRQHARVNPEWVREFVGSHDLMPLSRREALKHL